VHRARALAGQALACKLQYPDMQSAVEADLQQLQWIFAIHRRMDPAIDTTEIAKEIGARIREELDYRRELKHATLYGKMLGGIDLIRVPRAWPELSTGRLLTLDWLEGRRLLEHRDDALESRNRLATALFTAWWLPFSRHGVIHGDPHLGNYTVFAGPEGARAESISSTTAASASFRRSSSAAWSTSTMACSAATTPWWCTLRDLGVSPGSRAS